MRASGQQLAFDNQEVEDKRFKKATHGDDKSKAGLFKSFSAMRAMSDMLGGYCKEWDDKELDVFNAIKFFQQFLIIITCTAKYLIMAAALNPWSMSVFSSNPMFAMVIAGIVSMDNFFAISAFFGFYRIKQIFDAQGSLSFKDVMKIYGKRLIRLLPMYYLTMLFGIFIVPRMLSGGTTYMYEWSLFW